MIQGTEAAMNIELAPRCGARSVKVSSGGGLSIAATLISPVLAVLLSQYLDTREKHHTTFALPVQNTDASHQEGQRPEPRPESSTAKDLPIDHVRLWQAVPLKSETQTPAEKPIGQANQSEVDPAGQFMLLRVARDRAVRTGDGPTAFRVIDAMAKTFPVDADTMKMAVLAKFATAAQKPAQHKSIAEQALTLADQAVRQDHFMVATQLGKLALAEASRASDRELLARAEGQINDVAQRVKAREQPSR
jgi:hypothetical protein